MFLDNYWWSLTACAAHKNTISLWIAVLFLQLNRCHVVDDKDNFGHTPCLCPFFFQRQNSLKVIIVVMPGRGANNKFWLRGLRAIWPALTLKSDSYCVIWCCHHVVALRMFPLFFCARDCYACILPSTSCIKHPWKLKMNLKYDAVSGQCHTLAWFHDLGCEVTSMFLIRHFLIFFFVLKEKHVCIKHLKLFLCAPSNAAILSSSLSLTDWKFQMTPKE